MKILDTLGKSKKAIGGVIAIIVLVIAISHVFKTFAQKKMQKGGK